MQANFYLYRHIRKDTGMPFYIGIGSRYRAFTHSNRNKWWHHIVNKHGFEVEIMLDGLTKDQAFAKEIEFISLYGRVVDGGILVNKSIGGEAPALGCKMAEKEKLNRSKRFTGAGNPMYGRKRDDIKVYMANYKEKCRKATIEANKKYKSKPITAINLQTSESTQFPSQREASRQLSLDQSRIFLVLRQRAKTTGGYTFKYA
jgi:hypothetical protein